MVLKLMKQLAERWFVYILRCTDGSFYTGITNELNRRLELHNSGTASRYTQPIADHSGISRRIDDWGPQEQSIHPSSKHYRKQSPLQSWCCGRAKAPQRIFTQTLYLSTLRTDYGLSRAGVITSASRPGAR